MGLAGRRCSASSSTGPIVSLLPILIIGILFGLAMDYQVFLVSRMREEYVHGAAPEQAVVDGFRHGARVVTAAALIMIARLRRVHPRPTTPIIKSIGFALAFGVLVDAFVVRMTLVPGGDVAARPARLVAAALARPAPARRRRRGREAAVRHRFRASRR